MKKQGFDTRIVSYEYIHSIKSEDKKALIDAINPKPSQKILDAFCGYGAIGKECLSRQPKIDLYLNDESVVQLKRAEENLPEIPKNHFSSDSFPKNHFQSLFFDTIVMKMSLHEVSKEKQPKVLEEMFRILKKEGKLAVWDIMLDHKNQTLFQDIIRKKDELAGFTMLMKERYFFREDEFIENVKQSGFTKVEQFHTICYRFSSKKRLEAELHNDPTLLEKLNNYIKQRFPKEMKKTLRYEDLGEDIQFNVIKKIFVIKK